MRFDLSEGFPMVTTKNYTSNRLSTSCCGFWKATPTLVTSMKMASGSGTNGQMPTVTWVGLRPPMAQLEQRGNWPDYRAHRYFKNQPE
jgi:hypothetical protein